MAASCLQFAHIINIAYHVIPSSGLVAAFFGELYNFDVYAWYHILLILIPSLLCVCLFIYLCFCVALTLSLSGVGGGVCVGVGVEGW